MSCTRAFDHRDPATIRCSRPWSRAEIDRLRRFGELRAYRRGRASGDDRRGRVPGMFVILTGEVAITQRSVLGLRGADRHARPGSFMGELAQLSGRPSLVDAHAREAGRGARHSLAPAARRARGGGRARRAHHARADPAPRRSARRAASRVR